MIQETNNPLQEANDPDLEARSTSFTKPDHPALADVGTMSLISVMI